MTTIFPEWLEADDVVPNSNDTSFLPPFLIPVWDGTLEDMEGFTSKEPANLYIFYIIATFKYLY